MEWSPQLLLEETHHGTTRNLRKILGRDAVELAESIEEANEQNQFY